MNIVKYGIPALLNNYTNEYTEFSEILKNDQIDLMFCDLFAFHCIDNTKNANLPLVLTSTMAYTPDAQTYYTNGDVPSLYHPTIETQTIYERLKYYFYKYYIPYKAYQLNLPAQQFQENSGLFPLTSMYTKNADHALKLVNNIFGLESARPLGPLVEMVGPILKKKYDSLSFDIQQFLDTRSRVVYVAFGQHSIPSEEDTEYIMAALVDQLENGVIDGIYWASSPKHPTPKIPEIPNRKNELNNNNNEKDQKRMNNSFINKKNKSKISSKDILITSWAPQFAILSHPSTFMFVTHGGAGSLHEGLFNKVVLFVYPFFGDQPSNAKRVKQLSIGDYYDTAGMVYNQQTLNELTSKINLVLTDHTIYQNVQRYGNAVQIRSIHAVQRAADTVEELLYSASSKGYMDHRTDVIHSLVWFQKYNLDLFAAVSIPTLFIFWLIHWIYYKLTFSSSKKLKTL
ncbi:unnamed protein product [Cunninghamella blakesleeana]